jgi:hypothetical protein
MDRHRIWRLVQSNVQSLRDEAPAGYQPIVEVFLVGRAEPVCVGQAQTRRDDFRRRMLPATSPYRQTT